MSKKVKSKTAVDYVEVVDTKLINSEKLDTLVRIPFGQLIGFTMEAFMQRITLLAIGKDDPGQFKLNNIQIQLAGVVNEDVVFNIKADLEKYKVEKKRLPKVVKLPKKGTQTTKK